jgi:hypothetical protein
MELLSWVRLQWDRVFGVAAMAAGAVALVVGWAKVSGTPYAAEQIPYVVSAGLGGLFLLGVGATLWHSADLRDEWRKLDRLEERLDAAFPVAGEITLTLDDPVGNADSRRPRKAPVTTGGDV